MVPTAERARATIRKKMRQVRTPRRPCSIAARSLSDPLFPVRFLLRNFSILIQEGFASQTSLRMRRRVVMEIVQQRGCFFLKVKDFLTARGALPVVFPFDPLLPDAEDASAYCSHCGGCCEIASGLPEFPPGASIPDEWMRTFGTGLGKNHRFCSFLWEAKGRSLCAIHPWRSYPCRTFEKEECDFLLRDPSFTALSERKMLVAAARLLMRSIGSPSRNRQKHGARRQRRILSI